MSSKKNLIIIIIATVVAVAAIASVIIYFVLSNDDNSKNKVDNEILEEAENILENFDMENFINIDIEEDIFEDDFENEINNNTQQDNQDNETSNNDTTENNNVIIIPEIPEEDTEIEFSDMDKLIFNSNFTQYLGNINGEQLNELLQKIIESNNNGNHIVLLSSNNLPNLDNIGANEIYTITFSYAEDGYINNINIDKKF